MKFKVGDRVHAISGDFGTVIQVHNICANVWPYLVELDGLGQRYVFTETELEPTGCHWVPSEDPWGYLVYETSCDQAWQFDEGTPADNNYRFCPYCGCTLVVEDQDEE